MSGFRGAIVRGYLAGTRFLADKAERRLARMAPDFTPRRKDSCMSIPMTDWKARRSGAGITVAGKDGAGNPLKVQVSQILPRNGKILALTAGGVAYELQPA